MRHKLALLAGMMVLALTGSAWSAGGEFIYDPNTFLACSASAPCTWLGGGGGGGAITLPVNQTLTDCSGTITTGGTAQNAFTAQTTLHGFVIANIDAVTGSGEVMNISFTGTAAAATAGSFPLAAPNATTLAGLSSFTAPPGMGTGHALSVIAATTGHKYSCTFW